MPSNQYHYEFMNIAMQWTYRELNDSRNISVKDKSGKINLSSRTILLYQDKLLLSGEKNKSQNIVSVPRHIRMVRNSELHTLYFPSLNEVSYLMMT